jgi:hypothetical protein
MSEDKKVEPYTGDLSVLFPGEPVPLDEDGHFGVVYPAPFKAIRELMSGWYRGLTAYYGEDGLPKDEHGEVDAARIQSDLQANLPAIAAAAGGSLWTLIRKYSKPDPDDLPPDLVAAFAVAFVRVNFMTAARRKNWEAAVENLVHAISGRRISISETISRSFQPLADSLRKYLESSSGTAGETLSRTLDGLSRSSGTGSTAPPPGTPTEGAST